MGTVGFSFGSPTSGQGFDVTTTVASIVANLQRRDAMEDQLTSLQSQDTALTSIGTDLSTLSTAAQSLTDFEGVLAGKQGSSSNTDVLALTSAGTTAVAGSHTVTVNNLASTASYYSDPMRSAERSAHRQLHGDRGRDHADHLGRLRRGVPTRPGGDDQLGRTPE